MTDETAQLKTKEYVHPMPATWWLKRKTYFLFMVRELTCVAVGGYAMLLLVLVGCAHDKDSFQAFLTWMKESRMSMALHLIALPMVLYHSVTWLNLTPKAHRRLERGRAVEPVPDCRLELCGVGNRVDFNRVDFVGVK